MPPPSPAGARAALAIFEQVLAALQGAGTQQAQQPATSAAEAAIERLCEWRGALQAEASARGLPCAPPRTVRAALLRALGWFPASTALMQVGRFFGGWGGAGRRGAGRGLPCPIQLP
jgi:hypothetical protein